MKNELAKKKVKNNDTHRSFLYIGGFELPDKNAAAHRVVGIAKAIRELGHEVYFLNYTNTVAKPSWNTHFDFACYESPKQRLVKRITDISDVLSIIREKQIDSVIMYNYPAISMSRLLKWCKKESIRCYADATEWYITKRKSLHAIVKNWDSKTRMKKLHFETDGIIAISEYLYQYYKDKVPTAKIPPIVDIKDDKWSETVNKNRKRNVFVYAGTPSVQKECIDKIVAAIEETKHSALLQIIGITKEQFESMYQMKYAGTKTEFMGRIDHTKVIHLVKKANWSIIIRENNQVVRAGFPTKLVESISCGTPVIANRFSNIDDYLNKDNSILCDIDSIKTAVEQACETAVVVNKDIFDYRNYTGELQTILK